MGFIENAIKDMTKGMIESGLADMFNDVNNSLTTVTTDIGKTPAEWNGSIFNIIHSLSENVILPVAGIILTFVLGYEIVTMVVNRNNMHDFDISNLFQYIFKCFLAIIVVTNPISTMANREWGQTGNNYIKHLAALAFQGFFMVVCLGIYAALINSAVVGAISDPETLHATL